MKLSYSLKHIFKDIKMKYMPYSFSKINTFKQCQKKFEWTYVNKKPIDKNYSDPSFFQRGRFIHQYIANKRLYIIKYR